MGEALGVCAFKTGRKASRFVPLQKYLSYLKENACGAAPPLAACTKEIRIAAKSPISEPVPGQLAGLLSRRAFAEKPAGVRQSCRS